MSKQVCENCGRSNAENELYCISCGHILLAGLKALAIPTQHLQDGQFLEPQLCWGTAYFGDQSVLRIRIHHTGQWIQTPYRIECILGRAAGDYIPDVDLTPYGAVKLGVSRKHVKLIRQSATVMVQDLGSINGTFLNGDKLVSHQPRVLRNADELCLGRMVLRISFSDTPTPPPSRLNIPSTPPDSPPTTD
ncbi:MAG: FHA domain-containing protein [Anaerolineae bacterium]|nr:FHA domain-containing protein [Anaerolineae bacterium]